MRIDWAEPLSLKLVKARHAEAKRDLSSIWRICLWSAIAVTFALAIVRRTIPAVGENLSWATLVRVPAALLFLGFAPCALCVFPQLVHLTEKGIAFQHGSGSTFLRYEEVTSVYIEDRNELQTFVVRAKTKRGKEVERTAVASPKIAEADIVKFLADIGYGHLYRHTSPPSA